MLSLMTKFKTLSKFKVLFISLFLGIFLVGYAEASEITAQPKSRLATADSQATLQVTANVSDGGVLVYQWYSNTENSNEGGTAIEGANSNVFIADVPSEGFAYYYVVVADINANLSSYANITSDVAVITVVDYPVYEVSFYDEDLNLLNVEAVEGGDVISLSELYPNISWYLADSTAKVDGDYVVNEDTALFAVVNVREINDRAGLEAISSNLDGRYVLKSNIDLSDAFWTPVGTKTDPFTGRLSGRFHKITGLRVDTSVDYAGLFGYVKGGHILALRLNVDSVKGDDYVGAVAGYVNLGTITAVTVTGGDIEGHDHVGGIAGRISVGTVTATYSTVDVEATGDHVGGVTGSTSFGTITATITKGDITSSAGDYVGGVTGSSTLSTITATFTSGDITSLNGNYVGGVAGSATLSPITATFTNGHITSSNGNYVGGVTGSSTLSTITATFTNGDVTS
ncbi:MAG: hypothetical protein LBS39_04675, partial [Campylobacteraceae bacterium]|nr:hypothetical protein [Campylobacteraceae bacterium]